MYSNKHYAWMKECVNIIKKENQRQKNINAVIISSMLVIVNRKKKSYTRKRIWIDEILQQRKFHEFYEHIFPILQRRDTRFNDYFHMTATQFEELLCIVGRSIYKQTHIREPVSWRTIVYYIEVNEWSILFLY